MRGEFYSRHDSSGGDGLLAAWTIRVVIVGRKSDEHLEVVRPSGARLMRSTRETSEGGGLRTPLFRVEVVSTTQSGCYSYPG